MIDTSVDGSVRVVTLDRPAAKNALTPAGLDALEAAFEDATEPVVYLHGAGRAFCAGADLDTVASLDRESAVDFAEHGQRVARTIEQYDGAVVAGIDGPARGGGVELALACDLRVGTPEATLAESGVSLGLFGAWGGTARLPAIVGESIALDIALSGRVLSAQDALDAGVLSRVSAEPRAVADELAANDETALRTIKHRVRDTAPQAEQETREAAAFGELIERPDVPHRFDE
ncbi:enoyl-CoA hydratase/isomerase family protein [Halovenus rubra]|uniref:Enoyl-CoA hydratase/isomerase family protein n=2 Tax=Halovenus rubra TaxID=869890 RepID=A0ACC7DZU4_9EURY